VYAVLLFRDLLRLIGNVVDVKDWVDERLVWDDSISELQEIVVHSGNIWRPEFAVING